MDVVYLYTASGSEQVRTVHISGSDLSWNMTDQQKRDYAQLLFTGAVSFIKRYWGKYGKLPDSDTVVHDRLDFDIQPELKTAWEGYTLNLD